MVVIADSTITQRRYRSGAFKRKEKERKKSEAVRCVPNISSFFKKSTDVSDPTHCHSLSDPSVGVGDELLESATAAIDGAAITSHDSYEAVDSLVTQVNSSTGETISELPVDEIDNLVSVSSDIDRSNNYLAHAHNVEIGTRGCSSTHRR